MVLGIKQLLRGAILLASLMLSACGGGGASGGSGTAATYSIGGTVTGLNGTVVLQNNGADNLSVAVNGPFTFPTTLAFGNPYSVSILSKPAAQHCAVSSGAGTIGGNVGNVGVACFNNQMGGAIQTGAPLALGGTVSTFAGTASTFLDGTSTGARFYAPAFSVADSTGTNLYVSDTFNNAIRKIVIATGVTTTLAGSPTGVAGAADSNGAAATFNHPQGITIDATNTNLYVADSNNHKIRQIVIATGAVSSLTGVANTAGVAGAADGTAAAATFNQPMSITIDASNANLFVADSNNHKIRQIVIATGVVSSFTGVANTAGVAGAADGTAAAATFNFPTDITSDGANLYVADYLNNKIRKVVIATGAVSSFTGAASTAGVTGAADGTAAAATFDQPVGITTDGINLYVTEYFNNKVRQIAIATGAVSSLTGAANTAGVAGAADGAAAAATFDKPVGITTVGGNLYVVDQGNNKIRQIVIGTGAVGSLAGRPAAGAAGSGAAVAFTSPDAVTTDGTNLYVAETGNQIIRKIVIATGAVTTLAGQVGIQGAADGVGTLATFNFPTGITCDGANLYVADSLNSKIRKIVIATGAVSSLTGVANTAGVVGAADGAAAAATFYSPMGITTDGANLYVVDFGNNKIRKIVIATGVVSSLTGVANTMSSFGAVDGAAAAATFNNPRGITTDGVNLYVVDRSNNKIRQIMIATGAVSSLTGVANTAGVAGAADGAAAAARFSNPHSITTDGANLYVADSDNNKIRQVVIATGAVSSLTGVANTTGGFGRVDGAAATAKFFSPQGITTDGTSLYVTDSANGTIRKIQ